MEALGVYFAEKNVFLIFEKFFRLICSCHCKANLDLLLCAFLFPQAETSAYLSWRNSPFICNWGSFEEVSSKGFINSYSFETCLTCPIYIDWIHRFCLRGSILALYLGFNSFLMQRYAQEKKCQEYFILSSFYFYFSIPFENTFNLQTIDNKLSKGILLRK